MTGCHTCGGFGDRHDPVAHGTEPGLCRNCECPWNSCLVHNEFCCDACSHPDDPAPDAWDEADYRRDGDQALTAPAASIRDSREGGQEGTE